MIGKKATFTIITIITIIMMIMIVIMSMMMMIIIKGLLRKPRKTCGQGEGLHRLERRDRHFAMSFGCWVEGSGFSV